MKRSVGLMGIFSILLAVGCAEIDYVPVYLPNENCKLVQFSPAAEPKGFNGVTFGTELSTLQGMVHFRTDLSHGGIEIYTKPGDGFRLKNGKHVPIQYAFWKGKFYYGMVNTEGPSDWNALKEAVFEKYGQGAKPFSNKDEYLWVGRDAVMVLRLDEYSGMGIYYIRSSAMEKQMS